MEHRWEEKLKPGVLAVKRRFVCPVCGASIVMMASTGKGGRLTNTEIQSWSQRATTMDAPSERIPPTCEDYLVQSVLGS